MAACVVVAACAHALLALAASREKSFTADELGHLTGGYTFTTRHDYRLHPENGLLPQRWQALPAAWATMNYPSLDHRDWRESDVWSFGRRFFYQTGNAHEWIVFTGRAMNTCFAIGTLLLVAGWTWHLFGRAGLLVAMPFAALCPTMLAHSALATSDMAMAFFFLASASAYAWHLRSGRTWVYVLSAVTFSLACVAKYTAVLLLPMLAALILLRWLLPGGGNPTWAGCREATSAGRQLRALGLSVGVHATAAWIGIWAFCGFRFTAFNPRLPTGEFPVSWDYLYAGSGLIGRLVQFCHDWHVLPEAFLYGFMFVVKHAEARAAFLDGDYSIHGWLEFFPQALVYKTTPALLAAVLLALVVIGLGRSRLGRSAFRRPLIQASPLVVVFVIYWAFSLSSNLNIGHRHILPTYPMLYIATGALGWAAMQLVTRKMMRPLLAGALMLLWPALHARETWRTHPHYLAYFSPVIGGSAQGYRHLVDSSLDWGQDLPGLAEWLAVHRRPTDKVFFSYFGTADPTYYGITGIALPSILDFRQSHPWYELDEGIYAISATMLQQVYQPMRGPWTAEQENEYQALHRLAALFDGIQSEGTSEQWAEVQARWQRYENLRFARLCHYLRAREPDTMIGYSILIYRLDATEVQNAIHGPASALGAAMLRAREAKR